MTVFNTFPEFDLGIVKLRELQETDAPAYHKYMTSKEVSEFLTYDNIPNTYSAALSDVRYWKSLFTNQFSIFWGIALPESNELIGSIGFNSWNKKHGRSEMSYDLSADFWGLGIMAKSMKQVLSYSKETLLMRRVQATVVIGNQRSINVLEKMNFLREGILRQYEIVQGIPQDYYLYGALL
jgi:ribosomal-protein-alanine N-acetyltransferase